MRRVALEGIGWGGAALLLLVVFVATLIQETAWARVLTGTALLVVGWAIGRWGERVGRVR